MSLSIDFDRPLTLVTGGCGFIGRSLCRYLIAQGHDLFIVDDLSTGEDPLLWLGGEISPGPYGRRFSTAISPSDMGTGVIHFIQSELITALCGQLQLGSSANVLRWPVFAGVFHLAGIVGGRMKIDGDPLHVGLDLAIDALMFRWLSRDPERVGRVLYMSSSAAYPISHQQSQGHTALCEKDIDFENDQLGRPDMSYGWSKLTGEYLARLAAKHYGLKVACVRPFSGYGEEQSCDYPITAIAQRVARGDEAIEIWGDGQQGRDFIHIDDCIRAMHRAQVTIEDGSAVNVGTGHLTRFIDVANILLELDGRKAELLLRTDRPVGVMARYADHTRMKDILQFTPQVSLHEGLGRVLEAQRAALKKSQNSRSTAMLRQKSSVKSFLSAAL